MKSPFPGMDPYIEAHGHLWEDFHFHLVLGISNVVKSALPESHYALTRRREYTTAEYDDTSPIAVRTKPAIPLDDSPRIMRAFLQEEHREVYLDIYERETDRLVTRVEVLCPSHKRPQTLGRRRYLRQRRRLLSGQASLVEIDLLRGGARMPMLDKWPTSPYTLLVSRSERAPTCKVWPAHFDRPLPPIPVPLSPPDADLSLDLQPLIEGIHARSRYHRDIDYTKPLRPPLTDAQTAWLAERLKQRT